MTPIFSITLDVFKNGSSEVWTQKKETLTEKELQSLRELVKKIIRATTNPQLELSADPDGAITPLR